jgi:hypothetical protein
MTLPGEALVLYVTDDCALCDAAVAVLAEAHAPDFTSVCIDGDAHLEARYGTRVPVLHAARVDRDLGWPFDAEAVRRYVSGV